MASQAADEQLAPVYLEAGPEESLTAEELARGSEGAFLPIPTGWQLVGGYRTQLRVSFTDARLPFPPGMIVGDGDFPGLPIAATENLPVLYLFLERDAETCHVEITETAAPLGRLWAEASIQGVTLTSTRKGRAGVGGPTAVLDMGDRLARTTYDSAEPVPRSISEHHRRFERLNEGARGFMEALVSA